MKKIKALPSTLPFRFPNKLILLKLFKTMVTRNKIKDSSISPKNSTPKAKIMIIEDEKDLLVLMEKKLNKEGYKTISAHDGEDGLEKIKKLKPDLVLLDIVIPKKNGYEVLETIHKNPKLNKIPIVILSNSEPDEEKIYSLGARDYLIKADLTPEDIIKKVESYLKNGKKREKPQHAFKAKILLIEDDEILRDLCVTKLQKEDYQVITAIEGQEGLSKIKEEKPDLVLLDIILPGIDGFEILKRVQKTGGYLTKIPIILLTNLGQEKDIEKGKELGARDYLVKANLTTEQIIEKIKQYLKS